MNSTRKKIRPGSFQQPRVGQRYSQQVGHVTQSLHAVLYSAFSGFACDKERQASSSRSANPSAFLGTPDPFGYGTAGHFHMGNAPLAHCAATTPPGSVGLLSGLPLRRNRRESVFSTCCVTYTAAGGWGFVTLMQESSVPANKHPPGQRHEIEHGRLAEVSVSLVPNCFRTRFGAVGRMQPGHGKSCSR